MSPRTNVNTVPNDGRGKEEAKPLLLRLSTRGSQRSATQVSPGTLMHREQGPLAGGQEA